MRIIVTLLKVIVGLAIAIPVTVLVLAMTVGVLGTLLGLAIVALKLALIGLGAYTVYRAAKFVFGSSRKPAQRVVTSLPAPDPYYDAAMRELDSELRR
jgi:hypothetical protein